MTTLPEPASALRNIVLVDIPAFGAQDTRKFFRNASQYHLDPERDLYAQLQPIQKATPACRIQCIELVGDLRNGNQDSVYGHSVLLGVMREYLRIGSKGDPLDIFGENKKVLTLAQVEYIVSRHDVGHGVGMCIQCRPNFFPLLGRNNRRVLFLTVALTYRGWDIGTCPLEDTLAWGKGIRFFFPEFPV